MKPYVPSLLLDQFGNYAVQCCLGMGSCSNQFIFDAMVEKQHYIAQGRFGARAMRGILDSDLVTDDQRVRKKGGHRALLTFLSLSLSRSLLPRH